MSGKLKKDIEILVGNSTWCYIIQCKICYTSGTNAFYLPNTLKHKTWVASIFFSVSSSAILSLFWPVFAPKVHKVMYFNGFCYLCLSKYTKNIIWLISLNPRWPPNPKWPPFCLKWYMPLRQLLAFLFLNVFHFLCLWKSTEITNNLIKPHFSNPRWPPNPKWPPFCLKWYMPLS